MAEKEAPSNKAADLRRAAENIARENADQLPENLLALSDEETRQALHELRQETEARKQPQVFLQEGNDTILLVDDEASVLSALTRAMRNLCV